MIGNKDKYALIKNAKTQKMKTPIYIQPDRDREELHPWNLPHISHLSPVEALRCLAGRVWLNKKTKNAIVRDGWILPYRIFQKLSFFAF